MSLLDDIASTIGHTVDSLATAVGTDMSMLETIVNELDGNGIDVFSFAARLGLSVEEFFSSIVTLVQSDPHQLLLDHLTIPFKPVDNALSQLSHHWLQAATLHQDTAQKIDTHISELFQGNGSQTYSGPAADTLLSAHQDYQKHFSTLVEHAQTQHIRHTTLGNHTSDYLLQAPGNVNSLSPIMAAICSLTLNTVAAPPAASGSVLDDPAVQSMDSAIEWTGETGMQLEQEDSDPTEVSEFGIFAVMVVVLVILAVVWLIVVIVNAVYDAFHSHQNQQKNTLPTITPTPTVDSGHKTQPTPLTPAQENLKNDVISRLGDLNYDSREIDDLIRAGYLDPDVIAAIIKGGKAVESIFNDSTIANKMNGLSQARQLAIISQAKEQNWTKEGTEAVLDTLDIPSSEGKTFTYPNNPNKPLVAHTQSKHVNKSDDELIDRATKSDTKGGADVASSFPDEATAQAGIDMVIARSSKLQALIKAAIPGTAKTDKICDSNQDYGYGYQRHPIDQKGYKPAIYGPPTRIDHFHCVTVTIAIGPDGIPFVLTAYPSL